MPRRASFEAACLPVATSEGESLPAFEITAWNLSGSIELSKLLKTSAITICGELIIAETAL